MPEGNPRYLGKGVDAEGSVKTMEGLKQLGPDQTGYGLFAKQFFTEASGEEAPRPNEKTTTIS
jgi:hypothetical protein